MLSLTNASARACTPGGGGRVVMEKRVVMASLKWVEVSIENQSKEGSWRSAVADREGGKCEMKLDAAQTA